MITLWLYLWWWDANYDMLSIVQSTCACVRRWKTSYLVSVIWLVPPSQKRMCVCTPLWFGLTQFMQAFSNATRNASLTTPIYGATFVTCTRPQVLGAPPIISTLSTTTRWAHSYTWILTLWVHIRTSQSYETSHLSWFVEHENVAWTNVIIQQVSCVMPLMTYSGHRLHRGHHWEHSVCSL